MNAAAGKICKNMNFENLKLSFLLVFIALSIALSISFSVAVAQDAEGGEDGKEDNKDVIYENRIEMEPFNISLFEGSRIAGRFNVRIVVEVAEGVDSVSAKQKVPQMRADFVIALSQLARVGFRVDRPIDPNLISDYLKRFAEERIGKGQVEIYVLEAYVETR